MISLGAHGAEDWKPVIVATVASENLGIDELLLGIETFWSFQRAGGHEDRRRVAHARREVEGLALARLRTGSTQAGLTGLDELAGAVATGQLDPYAAADRLLAGPGPS